MDGAGRPHSLFKASKLRRGRALSHSDDVKAPSRSTVTPAITNVFHLCRPQDGCEKTQRTLESIT